MPTTELFDIAIIGAGIVGASVAFQAAAHARVLLLEAESAPGYHTTGRSAALFTETYGPPAVRALTRASRAFFNQPPAGFAEHALLHPRGTMLVGRADQRDEALALLHTLRLEGGQPQWLEGDAVRAVVPALKPEASAVAVFDPAAFDIDVNALLHGFLRGARSQGAQLACDARVAQLTHTDGVWHITTAAGHAFRARRIVNAAGAWADEIAKLAGAQAVGIEPRRRTAFTFTPPADLPNADWPAVIALDESWYFKPDAGLLLGSPANADLTHPHDVVPEELDVALGIYNIEAATTLTIRRPKSTWAGLRCFVTDGEPVCGFDAQAPGFFWAAALGGYGIQSSPAFGQLAAALLLGQAPPADIVAEGLDAQCLAPNANRF